MQALGQRIGKDSAIILVVALGIVFSFMALSATENWAPENRTNLFLYLFDIGATILLVYFVIRLLVFKKATLFYQVISLSFFILIFLEIYSIYSVVIFDRISDASFVPPMVVLIIPAILVCSGFILREKEKVVGNFNNELIFLSVCGFLFSQTLLASVFRFYDLPLPSALFLPIAYLLLLILAFIFFTIFKKIFTDNLERIVRITLVIFCVYAIMQAVLAIIFAGPIVISFLVFLPLPFLVIASKESIKSVTRQYDMPNISCTIFMLFFWGNITTVTVLAAYMFFNAFLNILLVLLVITNLIGVLLEFIDAKTSKTYVKAT